MSARESKGISFATLCLISNGYMAPPQIHCRNASVTRNRLITSRKGDDESQWFAENRKKALTPARLQKLRKFLAEARGRGAYPMEISALLDLSLAATNEVIADGKEAGWLVVTPAVRESRRKIRLPEFAN